MATIDPPSHIDIDKATLSNEHYRRVLYTTDTMQLVVMSLHGRQEIGNEVHPHTTQFIKVVSGTGLAVVEGSTTVLRPGVAVMVSPGTYHNIINNSALIPMKLYTIYSPPEHEPGLEQATKPTE